jgi:hypothetical protein
MIGVIVAIIIVLVILYSVYKKSTEHTFASSMQSLSTPTVQVPSSAIPGLTEKGEMTISMYVFISGVDRTRTMKSVSTNPLFEIPGMLSFEVGPSDTHLVLSGAGGELALPMIPQQKWVYLTVLMNGRKFDVMYDDEIVGSKIFNHIPSYVSSPLTVGNEAIYGAYIYGRVNGVRETKHTITRIRSRTSDTRGEPVISLKDKILGVFTTTPSLCPPGVACDIGIAASPGVLNRWETNYA